MKRAIRRFLDIVRGRRGRQLRAPAAKLLDETISSAGADSGVLYLTGPDGRTLIPAAVRLKGGGTPAGTLAQCPLRRHRRSSPLR
jgi:hypothetical protein